MGAFMIFAFSLFVDGATDAANSVIGAVSSGAMGLGRAVKLCAFFEFFGCIVFCAFSPGVAQSMAEVSEIPAGYFALVASVSLGTVALWSSVAWVMGLPTSEGHGISAALAGAGAALSCPVDFSRLAAVAFYGVLVVLLTGGGAFLIGRKTKKMRLKHPSFFIISLAIASAVLHGAQDGQKFLAIFMATGASEFVSTPLVIFVMASFMALGTLFCGRRIIEHMGQKTLESDEYTSLCADMASVASLAVFTALGIPASTTHVKMTALAAAVTSGGKRADKRELFLMVVAWIATFPICFVVSYLLTKTVFDIYL